MIRLGSTGIYSPMRNRLNRARHLTLSSNAHTRARVPNVCLLGTAENKQWSPISYNGLIIADLVFFCPSRQRSTSVWCVRARERKLRMSVRSVSDWPKSPQSNLDIENKTKDKNSHTLNGLISHWAMSVNRLHNIYVLAANVVFFPFLRWNRKAMRAI